MEQEDPARDSFRAYVHDQSWWLDEYALFRALHARYDEQPWSEWPEPLRDREPSALADARVELADDILYRQYSAMGGLRPVVSSAQGGWRRRDLG